MKTLVHILTLLGLLVAGAPSLSQAQETRLAFVNTQRVMDKAPQAQAFRPGA